MNQFGISLFRRTSSCVFDAQDVLENFNEAQQVFMKFNFIIESTSYPVFVLGIMQYESDLIQVFNERTSTVYFSRMIGRKPLSIFYQ